MRGGEGECSRYLTQRPVASRPRNSRSIASSVTAFLPRCWTQLQRVSGYTHLLSVQAVQCAGGIEFLKRASFSAAVPETSRRKVLARRLPVTGFRHFSITCIVSPD